MIRKFIIGSILATLIGLTAWWGWRWYTTPVLPEIPLECADKLLVDAVNEARDEVRRTPHSGAAWGKLAMVLGANGFDNQALYCYEVSQRLDPNNPCWPYYRGTQLMSGSPHEGIPLLRQALGLAGNLGDRGAILFRLALALIEDGELTEAEQHLKTLSDLESKSPRVVFGLGLLAVGKGDRTAAREHLRALADHPFARKKACTLLAGLTDSDPEAARKYQQQAAQLPADLAWPNSFEADLNECKVDRMQRIAQFTKLLRQNRVSEAIAFLRRFAAESPDPEVVYVLGHTLCQVGELGEGTEVLRSAIRMNPRNGRAHYYLGAALLRIGEKRNQEPGGKEEAREILQQAVAAEDQALALQSDFGYAHMTRGLALKLLGRKEESLQALRQALLCRPEFTDMHLNLGEALAEAGQHAEALEHLENAVRHSSPDDPRAREALKKWQTKEKSTP